MASTSQGQNQGGQYGSDELFAGPDLLGSFSSPFAETSQADDSAAKGQASSSRPPINFRQRWRAQSESKRDDMSILDEIVSQSEATEGSWDLIQPQDKRRKIEDAGMFNQLQEPTQHSAADTAQIESIARLAAMERLRKSDLKMPWEKGPLAPVFGPDPVGVRLEKMLAMPTVGLADTIAPMATKKKETPVTYSQVSSFAKKRIAAAKFAIPEDELLARCLNQIKTLLLMDLAGTEVGVTLTNLAGGLDETVDILQVLRDCFSRKATATVLKRTSGIWGLAEWLVNNGAESIWSLTEHQLYEHMCFLREMKAAPTRASHVLEALNFFHSTLRFKKVDINQLMSSRVTGAAHAMYMNKRKLVQAPQLTVEAVKALEEACIAEVNLLQTVVTGALLFCVFASARWADFVRIEGLAIEQHEDVLLIEGVTSKHKTARTKEHKTRLLPYIAKGRFLQRKAWGLVFVDAFNQIRYDTGYNFLPAYNDRSGSWANSPMTTSQASSFLQEFLEPILGAAEASRFSSHSCKPTVLTWAGQSELFTREERTLMGHHVEPTTKSATTYNRDALPIIHSKIFRLVDMIKDGTLRPDASRAERLGLMLDRRPEDDEESVSTDYDEKEPPQVHSGALLQGRPSIPVDEADEFEFVAHKLSGTIHVVQSREDGKLSCGRRLTLNMQDVLHTEIDAATAPFCAQCNAVVKAKS